MEPTGDQNDVQHLSMIVNILYIFGVDFTIDGIASPVSRHPATDTRQMQSHASLTYPNQDGMTAKPARPLFLYMLLVFDLMFALFLFILNVFKHLSSKRIFRELTSVLSFYYVLELFFFFGTTQLQ